jgi:aldose 1-epimerase
MNIKVTGVIIAMTAIVTIVYFTIKKSKNPMEALLVKKENFDTLIGGKKVQLFTLRNVGGITVQLTNYGGHLVSIITPDKEGKYADILLGYKNIDSYISDGMFQGAIVGPFANRIAKGKFSIDGHEYSLLINNGENNLHSAPDGFNKEIFEAKQEGNKVTMTASVPDMKSGFPGNKIVTLSYELLTDNKLRLKFTMTTDKKTLCNMTIHPYFNLAGEGSGPVLDHFLQIFADSVTTIDAGLIPTGEISSVDNTPFDFREPTAIGKMVDDTTNLQIKYGGGYDHNWVLSKKAGTFGIAVRVVEPVSKRFLEVYTNQPCVQFYGGNFIDGKSTGKSGKPYNYRCALALEPQKYPDSPNHSNFPSTILEPGHVYEHVSEFVFGVEK